MAYPVYCTPAKTTRRRSAGRSACLRRGRARASVAPLSRRQYCAPLNKSQMEQRVFFHLAALKAKQPRATWGGGYTVAQESLLGAAVGSGLVWSGLASEASCQCGICRDLNQMGPDAAQRIGTRIWAFFWGGGVSAKRNQRCPRETVVQPPPRRVLHPSPNVVNRSF